MRLLSFDTDDKLHITRDLDDSSKPYAILSHTWGEDEDEVTFYEVDSALCLTKVGYKKIEYCGRQAKRDGWQYFWVDTCCIDKANNTELSTAIRSMYRWYQHAEVCYVYLVDVSTQSSGHDESTKPDWRSSFRGSRWFTRGWTLQELLVPRKIVFYSKEWTHLGTRSQLKELLHDITGIPISALDGQPLSLFTVDERLQWAQNRQTKKTEDQAYCLLGIFGVFMCLRYGEGDDAFRRLRKEIERQCVDEDIVQDSMNKTKSLELHLNSAPSTQPETSVGHIELSDQVLPVVLSRPKIIAARQRQLGLSLFLGQAQQIEPDVLADGSGEPQRSEGLSSENQLFAPKRRRNRTMQHRKSACQKGTCSCYCHQSSVHRSQSLIQFSPAKFLVRCHCQSRDLRFQVSILQRVLRVALGVNWTDGLKLNGSLHVQATVKYTSPGFLVIAKCSEGLLTFEQARRDLCGLRDESVIDFADVSPDGNGILEKVIRRPWAPRLSQLQFQLVEFLMSEGVLGNGERLLENALRWVGEGPFVFLLETLVKQSLDASDIPSSIFSKWPRAACDDWLIPFRSGDPFYLQAIALLVASDTEFGGTTELQFAVLQNDRSLVTKPGKQTKPLNDDKNFLGQSVLHLAVLNSSMLAYVLSSFDNIDVDTRDAHGTTPLMYAMSYVAIDSACLLLKAGADPFCLDDLNNFSAWTYALISADMKLLVATISAYSSLGPENAAEAMEYCLCVRVLDEDARLRDLDGEILSYLLEPSIGHDFISMDGNNLLHLCCYTDAEVLIRNKTIPVSQQNKHGRTPLMEISRFRDPLLITELIQQGATIDSVDKLGKNALHHLMSRVLAEFAWNAGMEKYPLAMESAAALLSCKGKLVRDDDCRCPCSLSGCIPFAYLFASNHWSEAQNKNIKFTLLLLECLLMMQNWRPLEIKMALEALFRRQRFDELGMTHTCCERRDMESDRYEFHKQHQEGKSHGHEQTSSISEHEIDAEEIRDEEKEFAQILQEDCDNFSISAFRDVEEAWIYVLSRRVVMTEEALQNTKNKRNKEKVNIGPKKPQRRKVDGEIIMSSPLIYVSHQTGAIVQPSLRVNIHSLSYTEINLEVSADKYLSAFEEYTYLTSITQDGIPIDRDRWNDRRRELTSKLLHSAKQLREAPKEQRDWNMNIEE